MLERLLPKGKKPGVPCKWTKRGVDRRDPVADPDRSSVAGRARPVRQLGAVYGLFRAWQLAGVWAQILSDLQGRAEAAGLIAWDVSVDSTTARPTSMPPAVDTGARRDPASQKEPPGTSRRSCAGSFPGWADHQGASGV
jgi:hypothetical protein